MTLPTVKYFDPLEDVLLCVFTDLVTPVIHALDFKRFEEALDHGIIPAICPCGHRVGNAAVSQFALVVAACILHAPVGVM